jgi:hypothetical protein
LEKLVVILNSVPKFIPMKPIILQVPDSRATTGQVASAAAGLASHAGTRPKGLGDFEIGGCSGGTAVAAFFFLQRSIPRKREIYSCIGICSLMVI